jgi:ribonuclease VapC
MKVFDASAVLALLKQEPGADRVAAQMAEDEPLWISAVNYAEVVGTLVERGAEESDVLEAWLQLGMQIKALDEPLALAAARLRPLTRHLGLSLGDRCCLALAQAHGAPVITADRPWKDLPGFEVVLIR